MLQPAGHRWWCLAYLDHQSTAPSNRAQLQRSWIATTAELPAFESSFDNCSLLIEPWWARASTGGAPNVWPEPPMCAPKGRAGANLLAGVWREYYSARRGISLSRAVIARPIVANWRTRWSSCVIRSGRPAEPPSGQMNCCRSRLAMSEALHHGQLGVLAAGGATVVVGDCPDRALLQFLGRTTSPTARCAAPVAG